MTDKIKICENCIVGREAYELDKSTEVCPYIRNWKNNKCSFYKPIGNKNKDFSNTKNS